LIPNNIIRQNYIPLHKYHEPITVEKLGPTMYVATKIDVLLYS